MFSRPAILLDAREHATFRGFHALAAAAILALQGPRVTWSFIATANLDERLAVQSFGFDTGLRMREWDQKPAPDRFLLYLVCADSWPADSVTEAARSSSRITLAGLSFPDQLPALPGLVTVSGHDTAALAATAERLLSPGHSRFTF